jgi:hypothetical protein
MTLAINDFNIREALPEDYPALRRLAELAGRAMPTGRLVVGQVDGEIQAAVPIAGGPPIADPFRATTELVSLLGLRAAQLRDREENGDRRDLRRLRLRARGGAEDLPYGFARPIFT